MGTVREAACGVAAGACGATERGEHGEASLCVDPLNPCEPVGLMYAALGVHRALPLSHGASGCCRFQRMEIAKHFDRVVHVPSTMLRERAATFGGRAELEEALGNVFALYDPDLVVVGTTCMTETMGEDVAGMLAEIEVPAGKRVVCASTPGYAGSHLAGYAATVEALVRQLPERTVPGREPAPGTPDVVGALPGAAGGSGVRESRLCLVPGWVNPCDVEVAVRYAQAFFPRVSVVPDVRGVLDVLPPRDPRMYCAGGTPLGELAALGSCAAALGFGTQAAGGACAALRDVFGVRSAVRELPVGLGLTDAFVGELSSLPGAAAPAWLAAERLRAIDALARVEQHVFGKRALICCDADLAVGLAAFACDVGMEPACVAVGDVPDGFEERLRAAVPSLGGCLVLSSVDRLTVEQRLAGMGEGVDVVLGDTRNKRLAARLDVPLVRVGFPVVDRPLSFLRPVLGYEGTIDVLVRIVEALLDADERDVAPQDLAIHRFF